MKTSKQKKTLRPAFKCHGGKAYLKNWIIENLPPGYEGMTYIEPFAGAASVLFNKEPSKEEVLSDLHPGIIEIFKAIRDQPNELLKKLKRVPYSREAFNKALKKSTLPFATKLDHALNEYILRRMSRGGMKKDFAWSDRLRGGQPGDVNAWETAVEQIPDLSARLQDVYIFCKPGLDVIRTFNTENTVAYVDPPYLQTTRYSKNIYDYEMNDDQHKKLCEVLVGFKGKVIISGYDSEMYNTYFAEWTKVTRQIVNHSSQAKNKEYKTEILWKNFS